MAPVDSRPETLTARRFLLAWSALPANERSDFMSAIESRAVYWRLPERSRTAIERARYLRFRKIALAPPPDVAEEGDGA